MNCTNLNRSILTVVGLGEALFDCFPDKSVLGGAPLNMAFHAHQLLRASGGEGLVASCVGDDDLGARVRQELDSRGMSDRYLQESSTHPTGSVEVNVDANGQPTYTIAENVAWDHLLYTRDIADLAGQCSAVCFGTLAQRSMDSRDTIQRFLADTAALKVCDLNLRQEFFSQDLIEASLVAADVAKLNEHELELLVERYRIAGNDAGFDDQVAGILTRYNLQYLALTRGARGTVLYKPDGRFEGHVPQYARSDDADSVGAGDACCAGIVVGILQGLAPEEIVNLGNGMGAYVASQPGGTPTLPHEITRPS